MSERVTFMMGEFAAEFPVDRQYAKNHMWARRYDGVYRCGFTAYAVRLLQDVYFLDWIVDVNSTLQPRQEIGAIESKKAESSLYAPMPGKLTRLNELLFEDPSYINVSPYDQGWLFEIEPNRAELLSADDYLRHLDEVWEITQRTIKGQLHYVSLVGLGFPCPGRLPKPAEAVILKTRTPDSRPDPSSFRC